MELRSHQSEVIETTRNIIKDGYKKPIVFAPCSFGKTIVAAEISRLACDKDNKVLFLVHRRLLAIQTKEKFDAYGLHSSIIMAGYNTDFTAPIMITTVQTYSRRIKLTHTDYNKFFHNASLIFVDECHLGISPTHRGIYKYYEDKPIIGLTGSPARGDQRGLGASFDYIVKSIGIKALTESGYLAPVRYFAGKTPDLKGIKTVLGDYDKKQLEKKMNKVSLVGDILENWLKIAGDRQTIIFASGVKHSIYIRDLFIKNGIKAAHLDAKSPHEERLEVLDQFKSGDIQVVTNCQLFTEGYDADFVSCIAIARPTKSLPLWIQMAGRGQRIYKGKKDCVLLDFGGNIERHGFLDDDIEWSLDGKEVAWKKPKKEKKEKKPMKCQVCNLVFEGDNVCPDCGSPVKSFGKKVEVQEAELKELKSKKKVFSIAEKRIWYGQFKFYCEKKGYSEGWIAHKFREKFSVWPKGFKEVSAIEPTPEFKNWMTYQNIRYAKRKRT